MKEDIEERDSSKLTVAIALAAIGILGAIAFIFIVNLILLLDPTV